MSSKRETIKQKHHETVHPKETGLLHYFIFLADSYETTRVMSNPKNIANETTPDFFVFFSVYHYHKGSGQRPSTQRPCSPDLPGQLPTYQRPGAYQTRRPFQL